MTKKLTAQQVGESRIRSADLARLRPRLSKTDTERSDALLRLHQARVVSLPEPVTVPDQVNGRRLESWEMGLYVEAMHRVRRMELAMFKGLIG